VTLSTAIAELKAKPGGTLLVPGGGTLIRWLLGNDLVDTINLFIAPVIVGQGTRLFPESGRDTALELAESKTMSNGVIVQLYQTKGRPQYGATTDTTTAWS